MQKKTIIVRKCKAHRISIVIFSILMLAVITACVIPLQTPAAIVLYIPILIILSPMSLYYLTWQIRFEEKGIVKSILGRKAKKYSFVMLQEVIKSYYASERYFTIRMYFVDGKTLQFRMDDENAVQAVKILQRHCSIKTL